MLKKIKFKIEGMHCTSCETLLETEIDIIRGVNRVSVDYSSGKSWVEFDDDETSVKKIFSEIKRLNYTPVSESESQDNERGNSKSGKMAMITGISVPVGIGLLVAIFFWVRSLGGLTLMSKLSEGGVSYGILFVIGLLASFHCIGMCGGLVVAYSASDAKRDSKSKSYKTHLQYNLGRLISYTVIGAILGGVGSFFAINPNFTGVVLLIAGSLMIIMGLSFATDVTVFKKLKIKTPSFIARFLYNQKHSKNPKGPLVIGLLNGLMPCGPLQAMQLYALTTGSIIAGGLSMGLYALGTIPLMFGFGMVISKIGKKYIHRLIKFSGVLIILLALIMINRGLNNFGTGISFGRGESYQEIGGKVEDFQEVKMDLTYSGYEPNVLQIKAGVPVRWVINVKQMSGCTNAIMIESLGIKKDLKKGINIIEFVPPKNVKEIRFSCWMRMVWGKFVVVK